MIPLKEIAQWAIESHARVNQFYDQMPYSYHIKAVAAVAIKFQHLIPREHREEVVGAAYCHDMIEDARKTYNDVHRETESYLLAELVFAVTNEKGRNRNERASERYYKGIRRQRYASYLKLCDRIANLEYGKEVGSSMFKKYKDEHEHFMALVIDDETREDYKEIIDYVDALINS